MGTFRGSIAKLACLSAAKSPSNVAAVWEFRWIGEPSRLGNLAKVPVYTHTNVLLVTQVRRVLACSEISER